MSAYRSFLNFSDRNGDWSSFVNDLPAILMFDENLQCLFQKYSFFNEKIEEITIELTDELSDELHYWSYYLSKQDYYESTFYKKLLATVTSIFKEIITKYVPTNIETFEVSNEDWLIIADDTRKFETDHDENAIIENTEFEKDILQQISNAEKEFSDFSFNQTRLLQSFKHWEYRYVPTTQKPIITTVPIIKTVNFFDPTLYELIKKDPSLLKTLDWRLFEEMLADILKRFKYNVELTKATKDGGIDIIAIRKDEYFGSHKYLLQAKRYNDAVQVRPIRELLFLHDEYKATKSCLATTATFTSGAWKLAEKHRWKMELKDQRGILDWIDKILQ